MEDVLDEVAAGQPRLDHRARGVLLRHRQPGGAQDPGHGARRDRRARAVDVRARRRDRASRGSLRAVRRGRRRQPGQRARGPAARRADAREGASELLANPAGAEQVLGTDPETGRTIVAKNGRYGPYVTEVLGDDPPKGAKARTSSLFKTMSLDTITLDEALRLLTAAPRGRRRPGVGRGDHGAERPLRAVPQEGHGLALDRLRGAAAHDRPRRGAKPSTPSRSSAAGVARAGPLRELGPTPPRSSRSWSRTAGSGRTSPTASSTRRCARATRSRPSP